MNEDNVIETSAIVITESDVAAANQLSLHCPICAGAVEANPAHKELSPVLCGHCETLYHEVCWQQHQGKCAVLGCDHDEYRPYNVDTDQIMVISAADLDSSAGRAPSNSQKRLKEYERKLQQEMVWRQFWSRLFQRLLRAIRILD